MPIRKETVMTLGDVTYEVSHDMLAPGEAAHCDFCNSQPTVQDYPCPDFITQGTLPSGQGIDWVSCGHWSAYSACKQLIEGNKRRHLLRRSLRHVEPMIPPEHRATHAEMVARHQQQFFEKYKSG